MKLKKLMLEQKESDQTWLERNFFDMPLVAAGNPSF